MKRLHLALVQSAPKTCLCNACLTLAANRDETDRVMKALGKLIEKGPQPLIAFLLAYAADVGLDQFADAIETWNRQGGHVPKTMLQ